ncbi:hypothetical protein [Neobacillus drentensis]|uniref:hypothetical protein n=1 Tax=Neobacillus drentensis TaxID=220684 RepID=UPI002FFD9F58
MHKLVYWSVDKAGNVERAHTVSVSIDKTAPGDNSIYEDSGDLTPKFALTDNLSGVDSSKTTETLDSLKGLDLNFYEKRSRGKIFAAGRSIFIDTIPIRSRD